MKCVKTQQLHGLENSRCMFLLRAWDAVSTALKKPRCCVGQISLVAHQTPKQGSVAQQQKVVIVMVIILFFVSVIAKEIHRALL